MIEFISLIEKADIGKGGAYVRIPFDIKKEYNVGRLKVHVLFDDLIEYDGSIVNMGVKNSDGSICYILGVRKDIMKELHKSIGDNIKISITNL